MLILGIDPGSRITGYGLIHSYKQTQEYIASGQIKITGQDLSSRLHQIYTDLDQIIATYKPQQVSIEKVFVHKNVSSALKLGQARGAALVAVAKYNLPIFEYSPRQIKLAVVGSGSADKAQIQIMVKNLLLLSNIPQADPADALAIAICHGLHFAWQRHPISTNS